MTSSNKLSHELTNKVETILMALDAIELKLKAQDLKGAITTLNLIKDRKSEALCTIDKIKNELEKLEN